VYKTHACRCQHYEQRRRNPFFCCCNSKNGLFIEGRKRTNGMLLERLTFLINPLTRQIVALVLCVTSIDNELVHSFKTPLNIVTCEPLSTLFNVVSSIKRHKKIRYWTVTSLVSRWTLQNLHRSLPTHQVLQITSSHREQSWTTHPQHIELSTL